jgi:regulator of protease activity HflC (stomatin/prohibitin superfamily)
MIEFVIGFFVLFAIFLFLALFVVKQQTVAIVERFGKFQSIKSAGLNFLIPGIDKVVTYVNLRVHQLDLTVETKTKDNVFVKLTIAVQYKVIPNQVYNAYYKLESPTQQIQAYVFDVVRAQVPRIDLDDVFSRKDDIAVAVKDELESIMNSFGYEIIKTLVIDIQPSDNVRHAMNEINASQRLRIAANEKAEAEKILRVKQAEAESEANVLHGKGIAGQRQAITEGLSQSLEDIKTHMNDISSEKIIEMVLMIQYFDTLKDIGLNSKSNVIFVPHSPNNVENLGDQIRQTLFSANILKDEEKK